MGLNSSSFRRVLVETEASLTASHIASFPVWCCTPGRDIQALREEIAPGGQKDYSHVPIRDEHGHIRLVVHRDDLVRKTGLACDHAREIGAGHKLEASTSLLETIGRLKLQGFLLVTSVESGQPDRVSGIINHADLQKLPVRLLLFARLSELEATLREIVAHSDWPSRKDCLNEKKYAESQRQRHRAETLPLEQLEQYLNITGLATVAHRLGRFKPPDGVIDGRLESLRVVRNHIAHGLDFGADDAANPAGTVHAVREAFDVVEWAIKAVVE